MSQCFIRLHPENINRDSGIEIPEAWMPTIKKHNNKRAARQRTVEGANQWAKQQGSKYSIKAVGKTTNHSRASCAIRSRMTSRPHRLNKTSSIQSKRRDLHYTWLHRETNEKTYLLLFFTTMNNHNLFFEIKKNYSKGKKIKLKECTKPVTRGCRLRSDAETLRVYIV